MSKVPESLKVNVFDFDGVITVGLIPRSTDLVITGRGVDEEEIVTGFLRREMPEGSALPKIYLNPVTKSMGRTRKDSGLHKASTLRKLITEGSDIGVVFEDDIVQYSIIFETLRDLEEKGFEVPHLCRILSRWVDK